MIVYILVGFVLVACSLALAALYLERRANIRCDRLIDAIEEIHHGNYETFQNRNGVVGVRIKENNTPMGFHNKEVM